MKFNQRLALKWLHDTSVALPKIDHILDRAASKVLIIGAGVFDIYHLQGWIPALKRKTGDLDLSVGLASGESDYEVLREGLVSNGYKHGPPSYRYFVPKKIPGALAYIDLLAHSLTEAISDERARQIMGVGSEFSLSGMRFASSEAFEITPKILVPNPIAMAALKIISYADDPNNRVKDLADVAELGFGIVQTGTHFEMKDLWHSVSGSEEALKVKKVLALLGSRDSATWDLEDARQSLLNRSFSTEEIDVTIPDRLLEWSNYLE